MIASELISYDLPPLKLSDSGEKALGWMEEFKVNVIPVLKNGKYVGLVKESEVLDFGILSEPISTCNFEFSKPVAYPNQHVFELIGVIVENDIDILPVVDQDDKYLGVITMKSILSFFSKAVSVINHGSIISLELNVNDYSLSEIAKLVESDDAKILASFITSVPDSTKLEVTLKINTTDITRILHTFDRFGYSVIASYNETEYQNDLQDRYDEFMRFLNP